MTKERMLYIDKLKAMAMIMVVMGHTIYFCMYHEERPNDTIFNIICTFHVYLFFFLSGVVISILPDSRKIFSKAYRFLKPMLIIGLINAIVIGNVRDFFLNGGHNGYWYLLSLTIFYILLLSFNLNTTKNKCYSIIIDIIISNIIWGIFYIAMGIDNIAIEVLNPWGGLTFWPFFIIGYLIRKYNILHFLTDYFYLTILFIAVYLTLVVNLISRLNNLPIFLEFLIAFIAIFALIGIFHQFDSSNNWLNRQLLFIGNSTLEIYVFHYFFIRFINIDFLIGKNIMLELLIITLLTITIVYCSMAIGKAMKTLRLSLFILLQFYTLPTMSQTVVSLDEVRQAGLHVVEITTVDGEEPEGEFIESPLFPNTYNIKSKNKVPCRMLITKDGHTLYDSGDYSKKISGATIRINGNTTAYYSNPLNMPYKIKLEKAADLLDRGNDNKYKDKEWRLLKDAVSLNTILGLQVSKLLEFEWTAAFIPCNVIINDDYRGCYLLMETVKQNESCRINCNKETGYIVEKDPYWWKEDTYFTSHWYKDDNVYRWTWKYPDEDDVTDEQEAYIKQYIESMEESLSNGDYESYININSFAKWILAHDILGTRDSWGSNMFIKKYDNTNNSLLELPCLWDFDSCYDITPGSFSPLHIQDNEYFHALFNSSNRNFVKAYIYLWNSKKDNLVKQLFAFLNQYPDSDEAKALDASRALYNRRFGYSYNTVANDVQQQKYWYHNHINKLDEQIQSIETNISNIINSTNLQTQYFNISGIEVDNNNRKGIIIYKKNNGKTSKVYYRAIH